MEPNIGVNIKFSRNCFQWCPRKSSCCSTEYDSDSDIEKRAAEVAKKALKADTEKKKGCTIV